MAVPIETGHGSTVTFATSTFTASIISIGGFEMARVVLDKTHLTSGAYRLKKPGDVIDAGEFTLDFFYDMDVQAPFNAVPETVTIKVPDSSTGVVGVNSPTVAASAFCRNFAHPELVTDQLMRSQTVVVWAAGPTFVDEL